jgi:hypothetical protein
VQNEKQEASEVKSLKKKARTTFVSTIFYASTIYHQVKYTEMLLVYSKVLILRPSLITSMSKNALSSFFYTTQSAIQDLLQP